MQEYLNSDIIKILQEEFVDLKFLKVSCNLTDELEVFVVLIASEEQLSTNWSELSSSIATHYQTSLKDEFKKWNTYLVYLCETDISRTLRYKIENDKFANRKIVSINFQNEFSESGVKKLIEGRILNRLSYDPKASQKERVKYSSSSEVWNALEEIAEKSDWTVEDVLKQIEIKIKDEN